MKNSKIQTPQAVDYAAFVSQILTSKETKTPWPTPVYIDKNTVAEAAYISSEKSWVTMTEIFKKNPPERAVTTLLPSIWQIEPLIAASAKNHSVPTVSLPSESANLLKRLPLELEPDYIFVTSEMYQTAKDITTSFRRNTRFVVVDVLHKNFTPFTKLEANDYYEVHLTPGYPLLTHKAGGSMRTAPAVSLSAKNYEGVITLPGIGAFVFPAPIVELPDNSVSISSSV